MGTSYPPIVHQAGHIGELCAHNRNIVDIDATTEYRSSAIGQQPRNRVFSLTSQALYAIVFQRVLVYLPP
jgi:hypothetical protein